MKRITLNESIYELVIRYPEIKAILFELGFEDIVKPGMIQTVGKFMNLKKGSALKKIDRSTIIGKLEAGGFEVVEKQGDLRGDKNE